MLIAPRLTWFKWCSTEKNPLHPVQRKEKKGPESQYFHHDSGDALDQRKHRLLCCQEERISAFVGQDMLELVELFLCNINDANFRKSLGYPVADLFHRAF